MQYFLADSVSDILPEIEDYECYKLPTRNRMFDFSRHFKQPHTLDAVTPRFVGLLTLVSYLWSAISEKVGSWIDMI